MTANQVQQGLVNFLPNFTVNNVNSVKSEKSFDSILESNQKVVAKVMGTKVSKSEVLSESVTKQESITENSFQNSKKTDLSQFGTSVFNGTVKQMNVVSAKDSEIEECIANIQEMLLNMFNSLAEKLGISADELKNSIQNMSDDTVSLLDESGIKAIYMEVRMVTEVEILISADLSKEYSSIQDEFKSILEEMKAQLDIILGDESSNDIRVDFEKVFEKNDFQLIKDYQKEGKDFESVFEKEYFSVEVENNKINVSEVQNSNEKGFNSKSESHKDKDANGLQNQEVILNNLSQAFVKDISDEALKIDMAAQVREVTKQILEQIKIVINPENTTMEMMLHPEDLGHIQLKIVDENGQISAKFVTESKFAKDAIENGMTAFKLSLEEKGIVVDKIEVTVSEFAFTKDGSEKGSQQEAKQGKKKFVFDDEIKMSETKEIFTERSTYKGLEETVNYLA